MPISAKQSTCGACLKETPIFNSTIAAFHYEPPISDFIQNLKYQSNFTANELLANALVNKLRIYYRDETLPQQIIPVPLHRLRVLKRGFNQANEIAKHLSIAFNIPINNQAISRAVSTPPQADLSAAQRKSNLRRAFQVNRKPPAHCAIVDDVVTTGSTANAVAKALIKAGANKVDVWCLARAFPVD